MGTPTDTHATTAEACFCAWPVPHLCNESVFAAEIRLVQSSTESRTMETGGRIGELTHRRSEFRELAVEGIRLCQEDSV